MRIRPVPTSAPRRWTLPAHSLIALVIGCGAALAEAQAPGKPTTTEQPKTAGTPEAVPSEETGAQKTGAQASADPVADFLAAVRKAHWGKTEPFPIDRYRTWLRVKPQKGLAEQQGSRAPVDLRVLYLNGEGRARNLIRYNVSVQGNQITRGVDADGPWFLDKEGKVRALDEFKEQADQRRELNRHRRAASMLGRLLDPSAGLRDFTAERPAEETEFSLGGKGLPATVLRGHMDRFPLWTPPEGSDPKLGVDVDLWRLKESGRLFAVEVFPLRRAKVAEGEEPSSGKPERTGQSEIILLGAMAEKSGLLIPTQVRVFERRPSDPTPLVSQVLLEVRSLELKPQIDEQMFRRPTR